MLLIGGLSMLILACYHCAGLAVRAEDGLRYVKVKVNVDLYSAPS